MICSAAKFGLWIFAQVYWLNYWKKGWLTQAFKFHMNFYSKRFYVLVLFPNCKTCTAWKIWNTFFPPFSTPLQHTVLYSTCCTFRWTEIPSFTSVQVRINYSDSVLACRECHMFTRNQVPQQTLTHSERKRRETASYISGPWRQRTL